MKNKISIWLMFFLGATLNGFQVYKYLTNKLEYSMLELAVLVVGVAFNLGDWLIYNAIGIPEKSDNSDDVVSVNGQTGVVNLTTNNVADSINKRYVTDANLTTIGNQSGTNTGDQDLSGRLNKSGDTITGNIANTSTGFFRVPSGTTAQRTANPMRGDIRENSTTNRFEFYSDGAWRNNARLEGDNFTGAITANNLSGTNTGDQNENSVYLSHEFLTANPSADFSLVQVNSGTISAGTSTVNNVGVHRLNSSTTANSGIAIRSASVLMRLKGGEIFTYIFNPLTFANTTSRLGFHDSTTSAVPANGVFFRYSGDGLLTLVTADNSVQTTSATIATLTINTWYKVRFTVNANATSVLAELFNSSGTLIASVTQTTNIPTTARRMNLCSITTNSGTTATALIDVDFISAKLTLTR
jgi:hypothetical protein